jgi:hypothetical protein
MGGEDGGDVDTAFLAQRNRNSSKPFMKVCYYGALGLVADILLASVTSQQAK